MILKIKPSKKKVEVIKSNQIIEEIENLMFYDLES